MRICNILFMWVCICIFVCVNINVASILQCRCTYTLMEGKVINMSGCVAVIIMFIGMFLLLCSFVRYFQCFCR